MFDFVFFQAGVGMACAPEWFSLHGMAAWALWGLLAFMVFAFVAEGPAPREDRRFSHGLPTLFTDIKFYPYLGRSVVVVLFERLIESLSN
jgi:hypothetical protein